jgi:hypothetical protein
VKRRAALAASLGLTIIVGFAIVALGKEAGLFGSSSSDAGAPQVAAEAPLAPTLPPPTAVSTPTPIVIERIVYRDEYLPPDSGVRGSSEAGNRSQVSPGQGDSAPSATAPSTNASPVTPEGKITQEPQEEDLFDSEFIEVKGQVVSASEYSVTVDDGQGELVFTITPDTLVHGGALAPGADVSVHAQSIPGAVWIANEIEVYDGG